MQKIRAVAAFFLAPLAAISIMLLLPAIGLGVFGGLRSSGELPIQLATLYLAELTSVLPLSWYFQRTGRDGYVFYAFSSLVMLTVIGGYFTYKGLEVLETQHPFAYGTSAIRLAIARGLVLSATEGAITGICFRAVAGRMSRLQ